MTVPLKKAIVWFCGLDTAIDSDWCGARPRLESYAASIGANLIGATWDGAGMAYPVEETLIRAHVDHDFVASLGHSFGAWRNFKLLKGLRENTIDVAGFVDLCPCGEPFAWLGQPWAVPAAAKRGVGFWQHNDGALRGVIIAKEPGRVDAYDASAWGLHHASIPADSRVQDRLELAINKALNEGSFA